MENMNLATRCREAIAQVAILKKEKVFYEKQLADYEALKRENAVLRRQQLQQMGGGKISVAHSGMGDVMHDGVVPVMINGENKKEPSPQPLPSSPTTDLDRIMSSQKFGGDGNKKQLLTDAIANKDSEDQTNNKDTFDDTTTTAAVSNTATSNSKIPITIAPTNSSSSANQKDDEFDADIDMVDFFTKQSSDVASSSSSLESRQNTKSLHHHVRKAKSNNTDDVMPEDMTGAGLGFSPERKKVVAGDSLLSSLDGETLLVVLLLYQIHDLPCHTIHCRRNYTSGLTFSFQFNTIYSL